MPSADPPPDLTRSADDDRTHGYGATGGVPDPPPGFVVEAELGRGGMGVVYRVRQTGLNRLAALKVIPGADAGSVLRFLAESEAIAAVRHPNVVEVYQYGEHAGRPFLALEYCPGGSLDAKLAAGKLPPTEAAELLAAIAEGVAAAHAAGIVHRDLKPHNVLIAADGTPKVTDFGLAKRGDRGDLTQTNAVMGTPAYMPPEQARGETKFVGPPADVWAVGVILYEALTGTRPFAGADHWAVLAAVVRGEFAKPRQVVPGVSSDLELICLKCLSPEPHSRYPTAKELAADLRNWLGGRSISARPAGAVERAVKWMRRNRAVVALGAAVFVAMAVGIGVSVWWAAKAVKAEEDTKRQLTLTQQAEADARKLEAEKSEALEKLKVTLAESRRKTALNYLAYGPMCGAAARTANAPDATAADGPRQEFFRVAPVVMEAADADVVAATAEYLRVLGEWKEGPPPAELKRKSLDLARTCRQVWLAGVERDFPEVAVDIRQRIYLRAVLLASQLTSADEVIALRARTLVWDLYWGELGIVESPAVEAAMVKLGVAMTEWEKDGVRPADFKERVADLRAATEAK